jgi:hypothetical protein
MGLDNFELNLWQDGIHTLDGSNADFAYDVNGQRRFVRRYNSATGHHEVVGFGASYFRNHRSRWTTAVPTRRLVRKFENGRWRYVETNNGEVWKYITDDQIEDFVRENGAGSMADLAVTPADASPEQQKAWIREALQVFLSRTPRVGRHIQLTILDDSDCVYVYDETREPTFDEEITHIRQDGSLAIQLTLNRALRGVVVVPDEM